MTESHHALDRSLTHFSTLVETLAVGDEQISKASIEPKASVEPPKKATDDNVLDVPAVKKQKTVKDPNQPKKPATAYLKFQSAVRDSVKESLPAEANASAVLKAVSEKWTAMDAAEKKPWLDDFQKERDEYQRKLATYRQEHGTVTKSTRPVPKAGKIPTEEEAEAEADATDRSDDEAAAASLLAPQITTPVPERAEKAKKKRSKKLETELAASSPVKASEKK